MTQLLSKLDSTLSDHLSHKAINAFAAIGFLYAAKKTLGSLSCTLTTLWRSIPCKSRDLAERYGKGSWVLITGSTDGIGKEYAISFAKRGFNVIIIGRDPTKVFTVSEEIKTTYKVDTRAIIADFTQAGESDFFDKIFHQLEKLDISVVINNVGVAKYSPFHLLDKKSALDCDVVNILPMVMITRHYINQLRNREKRSCIINLSSIVSRFTRPACGFYAPSKAFAEVFSNNLHQEHKDKLDVICVRPHFVETPMLRGLKVKKNFAVVSATECVEGSLRWLGTGRSVTYGAAWHELIGSLTDHSTLFNIVGNLVYRRE